jgi:hypothetical protein
MLFSFISLPDLVLVHNTRIEKELNRKTKPQYLGPFVVERQTKGGTYVLREMNGVLSKRGVAAFRLVPYISRDSSILSSLANPLEDDCHISFLNLTRPGRLIRSGLDFISSSPH